MVKMKTFVSSENMNLMVLMGREIEVHEQILRTNAKILSHITCQRENEATAIAVCRLPAMERHKDYVVLNDRVVFRPH